MRGKSVVRQASLVTAVVALALGSAPTAAPAAPAADGTTTFNAHGSGGESSGSISWFNRSVTVQGSVTDFAGGWGTTQVIFEFWQGNPLSDDSATKIDTQTRSVSGGQRSFNFPQNAPSGGITDIFYYVCNSTQSACGEVELTERP